MIKTKFHNGTFGIAEISYRVLRSTNIYDGLNTARQRLFKTPQGYVLQATTPCAVAYGYARIRRLVRLGGGR
jgi:hypothetical protein